MSNITASVNMGRSADDYVGTSSVPVISIENIARSRLVSLVLHIMSK